MTSQAEDGELVVRNLKTGQEFRHPRGTGPTFSSDGAFVVFTIAQSKADDEKERQATQGAETPAGAGRARGAKAPRRTTPREPRTGLGIMALPDGKVTTVEKVGSFRMAEESSTWLAYYKGVGGAGGGGGAAARRGRRRAVRAAAPRRRGARGATPPAAARPRRRSAAAAARPREKRKDPGSDLILRNLATGEETTIPEVTEYAFDTKGAWLAYATSSADAAKDGAFARHLADGTVKTLMTGRGHYKSLTFDEAGSQIAFLSDQAEYDKPVSPYRLYLWKGGDAPAAELVSAATPGVPQGLVVADSRAALLARRLDDLPERRRRRRRPRPDADPNDKTPAPLPVDLWSYKDPVIQPMQRVPRRAGADPQLPRRRAPGRRALRPAGHARSADGQSRRRPGARHRHVGPALPDGSLLGPDLQRRLPGRPADRQADARCSSTGAAPARRCRRAASTCSTSTSTTGHWFTYRIADGARVNLTEKLPVKFQQDVTTRPTCRARTARAAGPTTTSRVLLYDEFDIWEIKPDGTGARMITNGEGRQAVARLPVPVARSRGAHGPDRQAAAAHDHQRRARGRPGSTASAFTGDRRAREDRDDGQGDRRADEGQEGRCRSSSRMSRFEEFPDLWVSDTNFTDLKKVSNANPQQAEFVWGKSEIIEYINARRQEAARASSPSRRTSIRRRSTR